MIRQLKNYIKNLFPDMYAVRAYAQEGEDLILSRYFDDVRQGFYVDVGAHHPARFSNTYMFYKKGWRGINIDAMPGSMKLFEKRRKRDINLEMAVSDKKEVLTYYAFEEPALNGFSKELSEEIRGKRHKILFTKEIETETLENILDRYLPEGQKINFLSVDAEGLDADILRSNNWKKYRPAAVVVESLGFSWEKQTEDPCFNILTSEGYSLFSKLYNSLIFTLQS